MNHLISDMGGEFEGELGGFVEADGIRQYFAAAEAPWQNGIVERNGGIWKAAVRRAIKSGCHASEQRVRSRIQEFKPSSF